MRYYLFFFVLYEIVIGFYFYHQYETSVKTYHEKTLSLVNNSFVGAINTFSLSNDNFHSQQADILASLVYQANGASTKERDRVRVELLEKFMTFYNYKVLDSFNGMHIFDRDGNSLLRFHEPSKHDDAIIDKRQSLKDMKNNYLYNHGLELGVYKASYRFQYPLFYDGNFVGSYEYSISYESLMKEMRKFYGNEYLFLFKSEKVESVVLAPIRAKRYEKIAFEDFFFYYRKMSYKNSYNRTRLEYIQSLSGVNKALKLEKSSVVDYSYESESFSLVVQPINDINSLPIGYMLIDIKGTPINSFVKTFFTEMLFATLLSLLVYIYIIKQIRHKKYVRSLINMQHDILIVTDGKQIKDANQAFLNFFGFNSFTSFLKVHACICDFFVEEEGFLKKENNNIDWLTYIKENSQEKHMVKIISPLTSEPIIFEITAESFFKESSLILFRDITDDLELQAELEKRANYDELTQIYNRASFEHHLKRELDKAARYNEAFSLIMFDIDHFKNVNDTYGHDVGDIILKEISALVTSVIRDVDFFARWGGEEFMIISNTEIAQSEAFAEKLRKRIEAYKFTEVGTVTCSFGLTQYRENETKESIIKRCDTMLYSAKEAGRNSVVSIR